MSFISPERCRGPQENSGRIGGFEKGEFERDSARKEIAAQICVRWADTVQLRTQEIDKPTKIRIVDTINAIARSCEIQAVHVNEARGCRRRRGMHEPSSLGNRCGSVPAPGQKIQELKG
jgi:hypothetical protein